ncbi:MAG: N-carbamoylsarcosine amidase [Hyphomicrobiales bacterium]|jgi:maleamate amidohydrolase|nr:N-carbamoylsarcosine amidase [Hyphomicrobiales bacterium]
MSDQDVYAKQGFGNSSGFGRSVALVMVDFVNGFNDPNLFGGGNIGEAIAATQKLLAFARRQRLPIAHTRVVYAEDGSDAGVFRLKAPSLSVLTETAHASQIVPELTPEPGELIIRKTQPSAFFDTPLTHWLISKGVDTLLVTGCTTSGCVRATVVDSMSSNFRTIVVTDCVGDRAMAPHEANLFDMGQKYADLLTSEQVMAHLAKA